MQKAMSLLKTYVPMIIVGLIVLYIWTKWFAPCNCSQGGESGTVADPGMSNSQANNNANTSGSYVSDAMAK